MTYLFKSHTNTHSYFLLNWHHGKKHICHTPLFLFFFHCRSLQFVVEFIFNEGDMYVDPDLINQLKLSTSLHWVLFTLSRRKRNPDYLQLLRALHALQPIPRGRQILSRFDDIIELKVRVLHGQSRFVPIAVRDLGLRIYIIIKIKVCIINGISKGHTHEQGNCVWSSFNSYLEMFETFCDSNWER